MNSEEIKEIGQMFLNISNQNHQRNLGLTDEDIIKGVSNQNVAKEFMEETFEEFRKNVHALQEAYATNAIPRLNKLEEELKDLKNNPHLAGFEHIKNRLGTAIEASRKFREEVRDKLHKLDIKETPTVELPPTFLKDKIGELGAKVGGYGGLISSLQRKDGERTEELNKIRKDYRELQDEMWERFKLVEAWIETKDSADKERIRLEILENGHTDKSEQAKQKLSSSLDTVENTPDATCVEPKKSSVQKTAEEAFPNLKNKWLNWETNQSFAWKKIPISKLNNVSVRAHNALIEGGHRHIGSLLTQSPYDLIQIKNFGRKCLREVMIALEEKNLALNMQKFQEQKVERNSKDNTQRGNLYGFKS